jgi:hypothetical protein
MRGDPVLSHCVCGAEVLRPAEGERPEPMAHCFGCAIGVLAPRCAWCAGPMWTKSEKAVCCSKRCKAARWKHEHGYGHQKPGKRCSYTKPSGISVSYFKLRGKVPDRPMSPDEVKQLIDDALSDGARARLAQRSTERKAAA